TAAEYYFGTDPGTGNATAITIPTGETLDENLAFLTNTLPQGSHRAFVRVKNANDVWSLYDHIVFSVVPLAEINIADINSIEYYFDADPGIGLGNQVTITDTETVDQNLAIPTTGLPTGSHRLFIRVGNTAGNYSVYTHTVFSVRTPTFFNNASIVAAEYFIDVDPGFGSATALSVSGDNLDENLTIPTSASLAQGDHYLHIRVLNADGSWSLYDRKLFEIDGTLGIDSDDLSEIRIFPIPTSDYVNIKTPYHIQIKSIGIIDLNGKVVMQLNNPVEKINLSNLQQGVYLLQIQTQNGNLSKRIIKN
ncbi:MAG TPA: hypothetical protein DHV22_05065, partial [Xanthomarina gelatinilytica]|nr:hypothetical protein [Xanthomarina gelatinilytica]